MYQHNASVTKYIFWYLGKCPLLGGNFYGVLYSECPLMEGLLWYYCEYNIVIDLLNYTNMHTHARIQTCMLIYTFTLTKAHTLAHAHARTHSSHTCTYVRTCTKSLITYIE